MQYTDVQEIDLIINYRAADQHSKKLISKLAKQAAYIARQTRKRTAHQEEGEWATHTV